MILKCKITKKLHKKSDIQQKQNFQANKNEFYTSMEDRENKCINLIIA